MSQHDHDDSPTYNQIVHEGEVREGGEEEQVRLEQEQQQPREENVDQPIDDNRHHQQEQPHDGEVGEHPLNDHPSSSSQSSVDGDVQGEPSRSGSDGPVEGEGVVDPSHAIEGYPSVESNEHAHDGATSGEHITSASSASSIDTNTPTEPESEEKSDENDNTTATGTNTNEGDASHTQSDQAPPRSLSQTARQLSELDGVELLKAQSAQEHALRLRELELRLEEEEEMERLELARAQAARQAQLEQLEQRYEEDEEVIHEVDLPSSEHAFEALQRTRQEVEALRSIAAETVIMEPPAMDEVEPEAIVVDSIELQDIQSKEAEVEAARVAKLREESTNFLKRLEALKQRDLEAKHRQERTHQALLEDIAKRKALLSTSSSKWQEGQDAAFVKAQAYLAATLETQKRLLTKAYGTLQEVKPIYCDGRVRERPQTSAPRLMSIKIDCLRAIKNKLPGGFYVVLVTLYDRLGGHPLRWCSLPDGSGINHFAMTPLPQRHGGKFYNLELNFNQLGNLLSLACPSVSESRPSNVLIFELVSVRGGRHLTDRVLAWGAFPLMNANKTLVRGRYKVPLMRGQMNLKLDKYTGLQERLTTDIDYWLCNLYFETNPIPLRANYKWYGWKLSSIQYKIDTDAIMKGNYYKLNTSLGADGTTSGARGYIYGASSANGTSSILDEINSSPSDGPKRLSTPNLPLGVSEVNPFLPGKYRSKVSTRSKRDDTGGDEFILPSDLMAGGENDLARKIASRERAKELRTYKHAITNPEADIPVHPGREKTLFILSEITGDLSLGRMMTLEFWTVVIMFMLTWWMRIYVHYLGQYLWLTSSWKNASIVYGFEVKAWTVMIHYHLEPLNAILTESFILVIGVVSNQICLLGLILVAWLFLKCIGTFSDAGFRFLLVYAINVFLDPVSITLVDCFDRNWNGDYFKLYNAYKQPERDIGYAGAFLTITLALVTMTISFVILFVYITRLHMNGRMLDVYHRLHSDEGEFFVPNDLELSVRTLRYILGKSRKWTGFHGTRRQVLLTAYIIDDHLDRSFHDRTLHLSIYNVTPKDGKRPEQRDIFRHFVRSSDGAIIEAFDAAESMGADGYAKLEERWLSQEALTSDAEEAEAADLLKRMLSDQKRSEAEKAGSRATSVKAVLPIRDDSERSFNGMSVVQELSQERSEIDEGEDAQRQQLEAQLEHIGEEQDEDEEEEQQDDIEEEEDEQ